jgi:hypothetical protein
MALVRWEQSALDELADMWVRADSAGRQATSADAREIDRRLQAGPDQEGESRPSGNRVLFVPPLGVSFRVSAGGTVASVLHVWRFRRR